MTNPIKVMSGDGEDFIQLEAGTYNAVLVDFPIGQYKKWESDELEDKLRFQFQIDTDAGVAFTSLFARPVISAKSNLWKIIKSLGGKRVTDSWMRDADACWEFLNSCKGQNFIVQVEPKGEYNRCISVMCIPKQQPMSNAKPGGKAPALKKQPEPTGILDDPDADDLPF